MTKKMQQAIEKSKQKPNKAALDQKRKNMRRQKANELGDEEITSNDSSGEDNKVKDDFFIDESEEENVNDKKTRIAKELLTKINNDIDHDQMQDEEEDEFLQSLKAKNDIDKEEILAKVLRRRANDQKGKLHHKIADKLDLPNCTTIFIKGHKKAITDFVFTKDDKHIYSVGKD